MTNLFESRIKAESTAVQSGSRQSQSGKSYRTMIGNLGERFHDVAILGEFTSVESVSKQIACHVIKERPSDEKRTKMTEPPNLPQNISGGYVSVGDSSAMFSGGILMEKS